MPKAPTTSTGDGSRSFRVVTSSRETEPTTRCETDRSHVYFCLAGPIRIPQAADLTNRPQQRLDRSTIETVRRGHWWGTETGQMSGWGVYPDSMTVPSRQRPETESIHTPRGPSPTRRIPPVTASEKTAPCMVAVQVRRRGTRPRSLGTTPVHVVWQATFIAAP